MNPQTTKVKNGRILLPRELHKAWQEAEVSVRVLKNKILIERLKPKAKPDWEAWKKAKGILKGRRIPDPIIWQRKIRKEWDRTLP